MCPFQGSQKLKPKGHARADVLSGACSEALTSLNTHCRATRGLFAYAESDVTPLLLGDLPA